MKLIYKLQESGFVDATADDWFLKNDVLEAVKLLKHRTGSIINAKIDDIFGDMTQNFDDIDGKICGTCLYFTSEIDEEPCWSCRDFDKWVKDA